MYELRKVFIYITSSPQDKAFLNSRVLGLPGGSVVKNPPANAEDVGSIPVLGRFHMLQGN